MTALSDLWRIEYIPPHATGLFGTGPMSPARCVAIVSPDGPAHEGNTVEEALAALGIVDLEFTAAFTALGTSVDRISGLFGEPRWMACFISDYRARWCYADTPLGAVQKALACDDSPDMAYVNAAIVAKGA